MCGIFGFILKNSLSMTKVFDVLKDLEVNQYPSEEQPLGGYGAGIAVMLPDGNVISEKVGKNSDSPANALESLIKNKKYMNAKLTKANVLLGHVRFPSPENMKNMAAKENAQPYIGHFKPELTIVSVHNGKVQNHPELRDKLKAHTFESDHIGFNDSEIIPHYFAEVFSEQEDSDMAAYSTIEALAGSNAAALLQIDNENAVLHLIYKGKARGLIVWTNNEGEVIFSSRPEPIEKHLKPLLTKNKFKEKAIIKWQENAGLKLSFPAIF
jgi:glucosamine 6-phosphate synthetase-like amidotransferase/phosphosugar isomerase protein